MLLRSTRSGQRLQERFSNLPLCLRLRAIGRSTEQRGALLQGWKAERQDSPIRATRPCVGSRNWSGLSTVASHLLVERPCSRR
jgi:hypothetical protein